MHLIVFFHNNIFVLLFIFVVLHYQGFFFYLTKFTAVFSLYFLQALFFSHIDLFTISKFNFFVFDLYFCSFSQLSLSTLTLFALRLSPSIISVFFLFLHFVFFISVIFLNKFSSAQVPNLFSDHQLIILH
jgi:hypothetical protein